MTHKVGNRKVMLFDIDGVVIDNGGKYFSQVFSEEFKIPLKTVMAFFNGEFQDCLIGKKDLRVELKPYLALWKWKMGVDGFLSYWFSTEEKVNKAVIALVEKVRDQNVKVCLVADQEKYRLAYLSATVGLSAYFDDYFISCDLGAKKKDKLFWEIALDFLKADSEDVYYTDDGQQNLDIAQKVGIHTHLYTNADDLEKFLAKNKLI